MKKSVLLLIFVILLPSALHAQESYLEVTAAPDRKISLAVAPSVSQGGGKSDDISRNTADALRFDMDLTGRFTILDTSQAARKFRDPAGRIRHGTLACRGGGVSDKIRLPSQRG